MTKLKYISPRMDTNFFAVNAIAIPTAGLWMHVRVNESGKEMRIPVRLPAHHASGPGIYFETKIPVLCAHPVDDTDFYCSVGYTAIVSGRLTIVPVERSAFAYMGVLPGVTLAPAGTPKFVVPLHMRSQPHPTRRANIPQMDVIHAYLEGTYLHSTYLDQLSDDLWQSLTGIKDTAYTWSEVMESIASGRLTSVIEIPETLRSLSCTHVPEDFLRIHANAIRN